MFKFFLKNKEEKLLAIETSCDDTAMCLVEWKKGDNNFKILNNLNYSQIEIHRQYGGVYPQMAKMEHLKNLPIILFAILEIEITTEIEKNLKQNLKIQNNQDLQLFFKNLPYILSKEKYLEFKTKIKQIKYIAVTSGPGLAPALWTGIEFAKIISSYQKAKIYNINHLEGHILSGLIKQIELKQSDLDQTNKREIKVLQNALAILISGGHTEIIYCKNKNINNQHNDFSYLKIGQTLDDAMGECYDKSARILKMPYPGGPEISKLSQIARKENLDLNSLDSNIKDKLKLPRPMLYSKDYDFSFSGLKTAIIHRVEKYHDLIFLNNQKNKGDNLKIFCREIEDSINEVLITKVTKAIQDYNIQNIIVGGGVSANMNIRNNLQILCDQMNIKLFLPDNGLSMDNALMIAAAAINNINNNKKSISKNNLKAISRWSIDKL